MTLRFITPSCVAVLAMFAFTSCQSASSSPTSAAAAPAPMAKPSAGRAAIRIKAGPTVAGFTKDSAGNEWVAERGFVGGDVSDRSGMAIANTNDQPIYQTEHYSMTAFSEPVPNGKYTVKLHFAETFDGITAAGQRIFTFKVGDKEFKDIDVWVKSGGYARAYVETVNVEVTNGKLEIAFSSPPPKSVENPEINGIEIIPAP